MSFAKNLTKARESAGYNKRELAEILKEKHPSIISNWEKGKNKPDFEKIIRIAEVLNVDVNFLAYGNENNSIANEPPPPSYAQESADIKAIRKELSAMIKINERLSALAEKLQDDKNRSDEERREIQKKRDELILKLAKAKAGEDVDL